MTEALLHFIWQFQYFNKSGLETTEGEELQILFAGQYNLNQGPDFLNARIKTGKTIWAGSIELHLKSSDWKKHQHHTDKNYDNVMLHVVWEQDATGFEFPVLELKGRVSKILLERYETLLSTQSFIPCEKLIHEVKPIVWRSWKDRLLAERLSRKAQTTMDLLKENKTHWEETFWWMIARNFGIKVNAAAFEAIARSIPLNILAKHKSQIHQLEALLFGQAGLLNEKFQDDYPKMLQKEYEFLKTKYKLKPIHQPVHFLRMRPGNFPTIRLAQLAALIQESSHLFSKMKEATQVDAVKKMLSVEANDYWLYHYRFDKKTPLKRKELGDAMTDNIVINTICTVLFAYGNHHQEPGYKDKALKWLEKTKAEKNNITKGFAALKIEIKNAFDSQALIELRNEYCNQKRCLECSIGNALLKQKETA